ncbi:transcription elongation factor [Marinomonas ushuaiensis DSM 15871]|uniref:Transcription elongation factor n=1 Tax=Marinomonas ushuaiensis DSM 15871 TaxID=1122207 RepID=X7E8Q8_9GAMM|nr:GreA/GreB family elongation factor [Marinomonas ushuaiensis]ETX11533.1 transcription elongation factor [Marinomonas ushuaiensis DSM 15871]
MDKKEVHDAVTSVLLRRFETAKWAAKQAHDAATNEESVAENKYDTFGLEASYLAHGQSQRVLECEKDWLFFNKKPFVPYDENDSIGLWCLVELALLNSNDISKRFFVSPCAGGLTVKFDDQTIYLITPSSPVGQILVGKVIDDEVVLRQNGQQITYEVVTIR